MSFTSLSKLIPLKTKLNFGTYRAKTLLDCYYAQSVVGEDVPISQASHMSNFRAVPSTLKAEIWIVTRDRYPSSAVRKTSYFYSTSKFIALYLEEQTAFMFSVIFSGTIIK
jgi:hypothetical protein